MNEIINKFNEELPKVKDTNLINQFNNYLTDLQGYKVNSLSYINDMEGKPHYVWSLNGGNNGDGEWNDYLVDLIYIVNKIKDDFKKVFILNINTDIIDDVFNVIIVCFNE